MALCANAGDSHACTKVDERAHRGGLQPDVRGQARKLTGTATLSITAAWPSNFAPPPWSGSVGFCVITGAVNSVAAIPEPATWVLMAVPLAVLMLVRRRRWVGRG